MDLVLNGTIFYWSIVRNGVSAGQRLQNVQYVASVGKLRRLVLGASFVGLPYLWKKLEEHSARNRWSESRPESYKWMNRIDTTVKWSTIVNFLAFLFSSRFPHLSERILQAPMETIAVMRGRSVAFDFMNRQLVWQGFTEFLLFFAPLIDFDRIQKVFRRNVANPTLRATECGICGVDPIVLPYGGMCGHASCYYCIAQKLEEDGGTEGDYPCPNCGEEITKETLVRIDEDE